MNLVTLPGSVYKIGRTALLAVFILNLIGLSLADGGNLVTALNNICSTARSVLFVGAMLLIVVGAVVYAVGQILGAETRARASVWATAMFVGAIIGILIYILVPAFLNEIVSDGEVQCTFEGDDPEPVPPGGGDECEGEGC